MKKLLAAFALFPVIAVAQYHPSVEYGVSETVYFNLYNADGTLDVDEVDGGTEVTLVCDGAAGVTATNDFVDEGSSYSIVLTATELQCQVTTVEIAATDLNVVHVPTYGNASALVGLQPWNPAWDAEVESEVTDALGVYDPPTDGEMIARTILAGSYFDPGVDTVANVTTVANMRGTDGVDTAAMRGTDSAMLAASAPTNFGDLSITATTGRVDVASVAGIAQTANNNSADINAILVDTIAGGAGPWTTGAGGSAPTVAQIADGVWDEIRSGHLISGSFGEFVLADAQLWNGVSITTSLETSADYVSAWNASPCASPAAGSLEEQLCTDLDAVLVDTTAGGAGTWTTGGGAAAPTVVEIRQEMDTNSADLNAILVDTAAGGAGPWTTGGGVAAPTVEQIRTEMDDNSIDLNAILADTNELQTDDVPGLIAALNDPSAIEIRDALLGATIDGTIDLQCALALAVAYGSGDWDAPAGVVTYRNPGDTVDRIVGNLSVTAFDATAITCP